MSNVLPPRDFWYPPGTDFNPPPPRLWSMTPSFRAQHAQSEANKLDDRPLMPNHGEVREAFRQMVLADPDVPLFRDVKIPENFIRPQFYLADALWADLISIRGYRLVSRRLREAMALPDAAAQFFPIDLDYPSPAIVAQDYQWLSWINTQHDVVDPALSDCTWTTETRPSTGSAYSVVDTVISLTLHEAFVPAFDLFRPFGMFSTLCATPALQRRVMEAGCIGVSFFTFGAAPGVPYWLCDEDGERIRDANQENFSLDTPAAVLRERPDLATKAL